MIRLPLPIPAKQLAEFIEEDCIRLARAAGVIFYFCPGSLITISGPHMPISGGYWEDFLVKYLEYFRKVEAMARQLNAKGITCDTYLTTQGAYAHWRIVLNDRREPRYGRQA